MNKIQLYYFNRVTNSFAEITNQIIPVIINNIDSEDTVIAIKNNSNQYFIDIILSSENEPAGLESALTETIEQPSIYSPGISHPAFNLNPGEIKFLHLRKTFTSQLDKLEIDYDKFSLDVDFVHMHFSISDLVMFVEFTESAGSLNLDSSFPYGVDSVQLDANHASVYSNILQGNGTALFKYDGDYIYSIFPENASAISMFAKALPSLTDAKMPIFNINSLAGGFIEFGINEQRRPYLTITDGNNLEEIVADRELTDYNQEYVLGVSVENSQNIRFYVNDEIVDVIVPAENLVNVNIASGDNFYVGNNGSDQYIGNISSFCIYKKFIYPSSVKTIFKHL